MNDDDPNKLAYSIARRFITYRPRSEAEVRLRLRRDFPENVIEEVIADLKSDGLIDDYRFARLWRESRVSNKPRSAYVIKRELLLKGVERSLADEAASAVNDEKYALDAGKKLACKLHDTTHDDFFKRLWGYLRRRGFSSSVTRRTIEKLWNERSAESPGQDDVRPSEAI